MGLINIGFGNVVSSAHVVTVISPESAPIKRVITEARAKGLLIDATYGRRTRSVIVCNSDHIILSAVPSDVIAQRLVKFELLSPEEDKVDD